MTAPERPADGPARIHLSPPHEGGAEGAFLQRALESESLVEFGSRVDAFEAEFAERVGAGHALALNSGTAALHLGLSTLGVRRGVEVLTTDLTSVASVNPIRYQGADPVLIGSEPRSWNMDPDRLEDALKDREREGRTPAAVLVVHLYGQAADLEAISGLCERYGVPLVEDAAEALGASWNDPVRGARQPGTVGRWGAFSFSGNKILSTSGGGMLVSDDAELIAQARKLAMQAREPAPHCEHSELGYNYRLSNLLAAVGRAQLMELDERVAARRRVFDLYREGLGELPGLGFQPEAPWGRHTRWLSCVTIQAERFGADREAVRLALEAENIEARPLWKPMHMQPLYAGREVYGGGLGVALFEDGLCLPSGSTISEAEQDRVIRVVRGMAGG